MRTSMRQIERGRRALPSRPQQTKAYSTSNCDEWRPPKKLEDLFPKFPENKQSTVAGSLTHRDLPVGKNAIQLYSLGTPNGQKVSVLLEELMIDYDAHLINIAAGDQYSNGFVQINPNSKIPAVVDKNGPGNEPIAIFESASILVYLADKYQMFIPLNIRQRTECMSWLFWQMSGWGPTCGNFGHYFSHCPGRLAAARDYGVLRYGKEMQRLCSVLEEHLAHRVYMVSHEYTIADMAILPWFNQLRVGLKHSSGLTAREVLSIDKYRRLNEWADCLLQRPATLRGITQVLPMHHPHQKDKPKCTL